MTILVEFDSAGLAHVSNQGIIELAYQNRLQDAVFEWQDQNSKNTFAEISTYLDNWPFDVREPDPASRRWFTPQEYQELDLDSYVLSRCRDQAQIKRAAHELRLIHQLGVEHIFRHLIYLVNQWRSKNLVWGIGRGSSVSCFVLYAIGLNKINPLDYDLDCGEFFKIDAL